MNVAPILSSYNFKPSTLATYPMNIHIRYLARGSNFPFEKTKIGGITEWPKNLQGIIIR